MVAGRVRPLVVNVTKLLGASAEPRVRRLLAQGSTEGLRKLEDEVVRKLVQQKKAAYVKNPSGGTVLVEANTGCRILRSTGRPFEPKPAISRHITAPITVEAFREHAASADFENYIPWMYLDSENNVTVGIGHLLTDAGKAKELTFDFRERPQPNLARPARPEVHPNHIGNAYDKVKDSGLTNTKAEGFKPLTNIILRADEIERVFKEDVEETLRQIKERSQFQGFETYPPLAKLGVLDMAFNLGVFGTKTNFPKFTRAVQRRDWKHAGKENMDRGNKQRAGIVKGWFDKAAKQERFFIDISCVKRLELQR
jgi:GH24 family phage-related lysozyme (muramidase)